MRAALPASRKVPVDVRDLATKYESLAAQIRRGATLRGEATTALRDACRLLFAGEFDAATIAVDYAELLGPRPPPHRRRVVREARRFLAAIAPEVEPRTQRRRRRRHG